MPKAHTCTRCGKKPPHNRSECPARDVTCYECSKKGHFSTVCRSTGSVHANQIIHRTILNTSWVQSRQNTHQSGSTLGQFLSLSTVQLLPDTGADVTGIPETVFKQIKDTTLQPSSRALKGPCQNSLNVIGQFQGTLLTHPTKTVQQD